MANAPIAAVALIALLQNQSAAPLGKQSAPSPESKISIFVGPQTRDGFVDVDRGVVDSIHDIKDVLRHTKPFVVVESPERATIVLVVLGRRMAGDAGSMILPIGAMAIAVPMHSRAIDFLLRAGTYERPITTTDKNDNTWGNIAKLVVRDVKAWTTANAAALAHP